MKTKKVKIELCSTETISRIDQLVIEVPADAKREDIEAIAGEDILGHFDWEPKTIWHSEQFGGEAPYHEIELLDEDAEDKPEISFVRGKKGQLNPACDVEEEPADSRSNSPTVN